MNRLRSILSAIGLSALAMLGMGQATAPMRGTVLDGRTAIPLADVHISVVGTPKGAVSGADGGFALHLEDTGAVQLRISRVGYVEAKRSVSGQEIQEHASLIIKLLPHAIELAPVDIVRPGPEVVYQREDLHVGDHFINAEGAWVLTYERPKLLHRADEADRQVYREARLHLLDHALVERSSVRLPADVRRLRHDAAQRVIVEGMATAWVATAQSGEIQLTTIDLTALRERVLPWTDSLPGQLLGNDLDPTFPAFRHFAFAVDTRENRTICTVQDDFRMELFRSQYKYMSGHDKVVAMDLALETGIDAEIIAGYMTGFHQNIYFRSPYAPLFVVRDTLCVFDHYKERIRRFRQDHVAVDEVPIAYQHDRHWAGRLLQDRSNGTVYVEFARNHRTWLRSVDPATGTLGPLRALDHPFPEGVQVHDGYAYYIHRPYGSLQRRTLYRQAIR